MPGLLNDFVVRSGAPGRPDPDNPLDPAKLDPAKLDPTKLPSDLREAAELLASVEDYLERGRDLKNWWRDVELSGGPTDRFPLERSFNRPTRSFGFFGVAPVSGKPMRVMGNVQEMFYDQVHAPASNRDINTVWLQDQLRQFVMKYFMRISSFRDPETYVDASSPTPPPGLSRLSWCPQTSVERIGFGFTQLFAKEKATSRVKPFSSLDRHAIVDQRQIGTLWDWLLLYVRIFDFSFRARLLGNDAPELVFSLNEGSHLVVDQDFINYKEHHLPGVLGEYGIGYSFVRNSEPGFLRYGPGEFEAAIELINFRIYETGYISVRMIFISNRPNPVVELVVDPVDWSLQFANKATGGFASNLIEPIRTAARKLPLRVSFDPLTTYVNAWNTATQGDAATSLCISREQFEKAFLIQHFRQHYQAVAGSLTTWRQIPDWLDETQLPAWVTTGLSS